MLIWADNLKIKVLVLYAKFVIEQTYQWWSL